MAANFDYYELAHPEEGIGSGFRYKTVPHVTLKSIANNPEIREGMPREQIDATVARYAEQETLYDQPQIDKARVRITGPFTVEAVPAPTVKSLDEIEGPPTVAMFPLPVPAPTLRHSEWRDELLKTGLRGKGGQHIDFSRVEPLAGTRWLHADAETKGANRSALSSLLVPNTAFWSNAKWSWHGKKLAPSARNPPCLSLPRSSSIPKQPKTLTE